MHMMKKIKATDFTLRLFLITLLLSFIVRATFLIFDYHLVWWDSAVYIEIGKYIWSSGHSGLFEHIRPVLLPLILGSFWKLNLDPLLSGRVFELFVSIAVTALTFFISKKTFGDRPALVASVLVSFSSIFFFMGFRVYTEIPAVLLMLISTFFLFRDRFFLSGIFAALAFSMKFTSGIIFLPAMAYIFYDIFFAILQNKGFHKARRNVLHLITKLFHFSIGSAVVIFSYFIFNFVSTGSAIQPFIDANNVIKMVLGCNYLRYNEWYIYLISLLKENIAYLAIIPSFFFILKKPEKKKIVMLLSFILPLVYLSGMHCRDYRYIIIALPFAASLAGYGLVKTLLKPSYDTNKNKRAFLLILAIVTIVSILTSGFYYFTNEPNRLNPAQENYFMFIKGKNISGEIWVSNPIVGLYTDSAVHPIYYPVYDEGVSVGFRTYIENNADKVQYIFLDSCGGGIICPDDDLLCKKNSESMLSYLNTNFDLVYNSTEGRCYYYIFESKP